MRQPEDSQVDYVVRQCLCWPDGTRKRRLKSEPIDKRRDEKRQLAQALVDKYNDYLGVCSLSLLPAFTLCPDTRVALHLFVLLIHIIINWLLTGSMLHNFRILHIYSKMLCTTDQFVCAIAIKWPIISISLQRLKELKILTAAWTIYSLLKSHVWQEITNWWSAVSAGLNPLTMVLHTLILTFILFKCSSWVSLTRTYMLDSSVNIFLALACHLYFTMLTCLFAPSVILSIILELYVCQQIYAQPC